MAKIRLNLDSDCSDFYDFLKNKGRLLKKIRSNDKCVWRNTNKTKIKLFKILPPFCFQKIWPPYLKPISWGPNPNRYKSCVKNESQILQIKSEKKIIEFIEWSPEVLSGSSSSIIASVLRPSTPSVQQNQLGK